MSPTFKKITNTEEKKRLVSNFLSLMTIQAADYVLPLITFTYLIRILEIEYFGLLVFATAIMSYFNVVVDYGFNLSAVKTIATNRSNKKRTNDIFSSVLQIKFLLTVICFIALCLAVSIFDKFSQYWYVYLSSFGLVIGQAMFPVWLFQGLEKMKYIAFINISSKVFSTALIFILIREKNDFYIVPFITSLGYISSGIISLVVAKKVLKISFILQDRQTLAYFLKDGWYVFVSRIYVNLYMTTNIVVLGLLTNTIVVGYYSIAEKIINAFISLFNVANQAIYPYLANLYTKNNDLFFSTFKNIIVFYFIASTIIFMLLQYSGESIINLVNGVRDVRIEEVFYILTFLIFILPYSQLLTNGLIIKEKNKEFSAVLRNTFLLNLLLMPVAILSYSTLGLATSVIIVQFFAVYSCFKVFYRK